MIILTFRAVILDFFNQNFGMSHRSLAAVLQVQPAAVLSVLLANAKRY
jgi:hypothetical protein